MAIKYSINKIVLEAYFISKYETFKYNHHDKSDTENTLLRHLAEL